MNIKLQQFKKRNQKRNAHLYLPNLQAGYDYVICPLSGERLSMIKDNYITNILEIEIEDYPKVQRICHKRIENIKNGLQKIDSDSGLTKYEIGQIKARNSLSEIGSDGLRGYDKKGQKTRATHMSKIDEFGRNGYSQLATKAIIKGNKTKAKKGLISLNGNEFKRYKAIVLYLTNRYRKELTDGYITGLAGKENAYHLDHIFSILKGYQQKISPFVVGHKNNLRMIPWKENITKKSSCAITADKLLKICEVSFNESLSDFEQILDLIKKDINEDVPVNAAYLLERYYESTICS